MPDPAYNVGLYGGSFNPLHLGHVDCILQAAALCKELYIVLSVSTQGREIDERVRYRWLYSVTAQFDHVRLLTLDDHTAGKADYTLDVALKDCEDIRARIGKPIDVVFCGSDYGENSFWHVGYPQSKHIIFPRSAVSSSAIRENPMAHWDDLPRVVQPYYAKRVLLMGGESTGKSTLTRSLAQRFGTNYIEEAGRDISLRSGTDEMMLPEDFTEILLTHKLNEMRAIEESRRVLFIDTDALTTQFYLRFLTGKRAEENIALSNAVAALSRYDLILFLEPDVAFVQDGTRSETIAADRDAYSRQIKALLDARKRPYTCLSGSYHDRYMQAVALVEKLLS